MPAQKVPTRRSDITAPTGPATWGKQMGAAGSDSATSVATDAAGNTYVAATFSNTITIGTTSLVSAGAQDVAVREILAERRGAVGASHGRDAQRPTGWLAVDASGNVDLVGTFSGSASFGGATLAVTGGSQVDMFVASTTAHRRASVVEGLRRCVHRPGEGRSGRQHRQRVLHRVLRRHGELRRRAAQCSFTSDLDVFIAKFTSAGAYTWAKHWTNTGNDQAYGIAVDGQGNVAIGGAFSNSINFGGGDLVSANAMTDAFVADFTTNGVYRWQRRLGAPDGSEGARGIAVDGAGNVVVVGAGLKAFDLGGGSVAAFGSSDGWVGKYAAANGVYQWGARLGGTGNDYANAVAVDSCGQRPRRGCIRGHRKFQRSLGVVTRSIRRLRREVLERGRANVGAHLWRDLGRLVQRRRRNTRHEREPGLGGYFYGTATFEGTSMTSAGAADGVVVRTTP